MLDLGRLVSNVETDGGTIRGIDLGSVYDGPRAKDATDYRVGLAEIVRASGDYRVRCHAMVSGGDWATRYYIAEPLRRCRHHQVYPGSDYCRGEPIDYCESA